MIHQASGRGCLLVIAGISSEELLGLRVQSTSAPDISVKADASRRADTRLEAAPLIEVVLADDELSRAGLAGDGGGAGQSGRHESESCADLHGRCGCTTTRLDEERKSGCPRAEQPAYIRLNSPSGEVFLETRCELMILFRCNLMDETDPTSSNETKHASPARHSRRTQVSVHPDASMEGDSSASVKPPRTELCQIQIGINTPSFRITPSERPKMTFGDMAMPRCSFRGPCFSFNSFALTETLGDRHLAANGYVPLPIPRAPLIRFGPRHTPRV